MSRLLLTAALLLIVMWVARRVLASRRRGSGRAAGRSEGRAIGAPDRLLCGVCGAEFDPEASGWICPRCER